MARTSRINRAEAAIEEAEVALAGPLLSYDQEIANLMIANACTRQQAREMLESVQPDPQAHIYHSELMQPRIDLLAVENEYADSYPVPIQQRNLLTQEAHHRIKNSLQLVQSLLSLQATQTLDEVASRQLSESAARIHVIGAMHDRLYRSETMLDVEVRPYLMALVKDLRQGMASAVSGRLILLHTDNAVWAADDILTLGLVLTELVTNALKYGAGNINIYFYQEASQQGVLIVEDEGTLPSEFNFSLTPVLALGLFKNWLGNERAL
jgi:two-component sensor histidine kinase